MRSEGFDRRPGGFAVGGLLEAGAVEVVLLELRGDAAAGEAAVLGAAGDVAAVAGEELGEVVALDLADEVVGDLGEGAVDVDEGARGGGGLAGAGGDGGGEGVAVDAGAVGHGDGG